MDENIDFKKIWNQQQVEKPNFNDMLICVKKYKKLSLIKLAIANVLFILTTLFLVFIWFYFKPEYLSTQIGIIITILGMLIYVLSFNSMSKSIKKIDTNQENISYLKELKNIFIKQKFIQTKMLSLYFILLLLGICLYMYEYTQKMSFFWTSFTYLILFIWIGFNWFYIRPKTIKKQQLKLNNLIQKYETIQAELKKN